MLESAGTLTTVCIGFHLETLFSFFPFFPGFSGDFFQMLYGRTVVNVPTHACMYLKYFSICPQKKQTEVCFLLTMRSTTYSCLKNRSSILIWVCASTVCKQSGPKPVLIDSGWVKGSEHLQQRPSCNSDTFLSRRI